MSYYLFVGSTDCSAFRKYSCKFRKIACFFSNFERYNDLGICLWNPKRHRISEKSSNVADSATNLILACCGFQSLFADFTCNLRIPITICGFHLQLRIPQQLNLTIKMSYYLFVDSTNCSAFRKYSCKFSKIACFLSNFERYNDLGICLWNPKQQRISEKSSNVADSATNLILACCGFHLHFADSTYILRIPLTVADSATALFNDTNVLSFVCGFHKLFWVPQIQLQISQNCLFFEQF